MPQRSHSVSSDDEDTPLAQRYVQSAFVAPETVPVRMVAHETTPHIKRQRDEPMDDEPSAGSGAAGYSMVPKLNDLQLQSNSSQRLNDRTVSSSATVARRMRTPLFDKATLRSASLFVPPTMSNMHLPPALEQVLLTHQKEGLRFLLERIVVRGEGGVLADYMGLGKTMQVLSFCSIVLGTREFRTRCFAHLDKTFAMQRHVRSESIKPVAVPSLRVRPLRIVVVSPSGVNPQWVDEAVKYSAAISKSDAEPFQNAHRFVPFNECWLCDDANATFAAAPPLPKSTSWVFCIHADSNHKSALMDVFHRCGGLLCISYSQIVLPVCQHAQVDVICLDEGHKIRNQNTIVSQWMYSQRTPLRIIATGYLIQNRLNDLYHLLMYVSCGGVTQALGNSVSFQRHFADPLHGGVGIHQSQASSRKLFDPRDQGQQKRSMEWCERRAAVFYSLTKPYILRRGLPVLRALVGQQRNVFYVEVRPDMAQLKAYNSLKATSSSPLDLLIMSSEISNLPPSSWRPSFRSCLVTHPQPQQQLETEMEHTSDMSSNRCSTYDTSEKKEDPDEGDRWSTYVSPKMMLLWSVAMSMRRLGRKVIAFSQFHSVLDEVPKALARMHQRHHYCDPTQLLQVARCDGTMPVDDRVRICRRFNSIRTEASSSSSCDTDEDAPLDVLLFSLKAGCEGLNLVGGSMVVSLDVSFNPAAEHESFARAYRLGQATAVDIVVLVMANSCEAGRLQMQDSKSKLTDFCVDANFTSSVSTEESVGADTTQPQPLTWWKDLPDLREVDALDTSVSNSFLADKTMQRSSGASVGCSSGTCEGVESVPLESYLTEVLPKCSALIHRVRWMNDDECPFVADESLAGDSLWSHRTAVAIGKDDEARQRRLNTLIEIGLQELAYEKLHGADVADVRGLKDDALVEERATSPAAVSSFFSSPTSAHSAQFAQLSSLPLTFFSSEGPSERRFDAALDAASVTPISAVIDDEFAFDDF